MENIALFINNFIAQVKYINRKYELSKDLPEDWFEPGMMENLDQFYGFYDEQNNSAIIRTNIKGLRYKNRTLLLEEYNVGNEVKIVRDNQNLYNPNNFNVLSLKNDDLGTLSAELCDAIAPLYDLGCLIIEDSRISYIERLEERSRYAKQGVLFVEMKIKIIAI